MQQNESQLDFLLVCLVKLHISDKRNVRIRILCLLARNNIIRFHT
jgi:hypothetical protein